MRVLRLGPLRVQSPLLVALPSLALGIQEAGAKGMVGEKS